MSLQEKYIKDVLNQLTVDRKTKIRIKEDLYELISERCYTESMDPVDYFGTPKDMAKDFMEGMGKSYNIRIKREYKSDAKVFGIPLVHINYERNGLAVGIFAVGGISVGVFSFGGLSVGVLGFGGLSLALLIGFGGLSVAGLVAIGGMAVGGLLAAGGMAVSNFLSMGGLAIGKIAIGDETRGIINLYQSNGTGEYLFKLPLQDVDLVIETMKQTFEGMPNFILEGFKYWLGN